MKDGSGEEQMSSLVWVCTSTHEASRVSVIDANNPADVLETFRVSVSHILCIASIPGQWYDIILWKYPMSLFTLDYSLFACKGRDTEVGDK